jgi:hypothetical protein
LKLLPLALSMAAPATAQSLIDYDLVMQENADRVVVATDAEGRETRTLDMGNGVMISCGPDGCIGMDMTDKGALGCTFAIFTELQAFAQVCEGVLDADGKAAMTEAFDTVGQIVARNAVPPLPATYPQEVLDATVARLQAGLGDDPAGQCQAQMDGDVGMMLLAVVQGWQAGEGRPDPSDDRLPVMNPCL